MEESPKPVVQRMRIKLRSPNLSFSCGISYRGNCIDLRFYFCGLDTFEVL